MSLSLELHWHILQAVLCTGWTSCSYLTQTPSRLDVFFLSIFRLYPGWKMSFENNSVRKKSISKCVFCWGSRLSSRELGQKYKFGGTIGFGESYLEFLFRHLKVFRLHAILHDAAGAVRAHSCKRPGYSYMSGRISYSYADQIHVCSVTWTDYSFAFT